jgi:type I restriction enzyme, S subunit
LSDLDIAIPKHWSVAKIEEILCPLSDGRLIHQGWSPQCEKEPSPSEEIWGVLRTTSIQPSSFQDHYNKRLPGTLKARDVLEVVAGDILVTCAGPRSRCGIACLVRNTRKRLMISGKMYRFRVPEGQIDSRYVEAFFQTGTAQQAIDRMKTGGSDSGLNLTHERFRQLPVPIAPSNEQRLIADTIEALLTELDSAIKGLKHVQANLKRYRASVLKAACEGRLVTTEAELARKEGRSYETGKQLLARILKERRAKWEADQLARLLATIGPPINNDWKKKYKEPRAPQSDKLPVLPEGWTWATAEQLSDETRAITYGVIKLGSDHPGGVPTFRSSDVRHLKLELDHVKVIDPSIARNYKRTFLRGGEIIITVRGTLGGVVCVPHTCSGYNVSREVAMIAPVITEMGRGLASLIAAPSMQAWLLRNTSGIAYTGVNIERVKALPIPLPPLVELRRIQDAVDTQLSAVESSLNAIEVSLQRADRLRQSILKRAFEGKLVPQNRNDEPASVLLERIRADRANPIRRNGKPKPKAVGVEA